MTPYIYEKENSLLREKPTMVEPIRLNFTVDEYGVGENQFQSAIIRYRDPILSLRTIPTPNGLPLPDGYECVEGRDYKIVNNCSIGNHNCLCLDIYGQFTLGDKEKCFFAESVALHIEGERRFVYFIEDTHPAKVAKWLGTEFEPDTSWTAKMTCWTDNPANALQFKTFDEAETCRKELNIDGYIVTEHEFVNNKHVDKSQNCQSEGEKKEEKDSLFNIPDGEEDWTIGSETFTRQEVFKLLYTQRAMITNDLKRYAGKDLTDDIYAVINHPRTPKF